MPAAIAEHEQRPRKASREIRRAQLIEATLETLERRGYAGTTMAEVARAAGLSVGIINFHFESKDKLLIATLKALADEYRENWLAALDTAPPNPAARLLAMVTSDFNSTVCTPRKLAAWCAFWGEAQNRPQYLELVGTNDDTYHGTLMQLCADVIDDGAYRHRDAALVARALDAMLEGLWLDLMTSSRPVALDVAVATVKATLRAFFPDHYRAA